MKFGIEEAPPSTPWLTKALELTSRHGALYGRPYLPPGPARARIARKKIRAYAGQTAVDVEAKMGG
jgi:hypothetical protein